MGLDSIVIYSMCGIAAAGVKRLVLPSALVVILASTSIADWLVEPSTRLDVQELLFAILIVIAAASWWPMALRGHGGGPLSLWVTVNSLNIADALFTHLAIQSDKAVEWNPVVNSLGLTIKLIVVAAATSLIGWKRPSALRMPTIVLGILLAWHVGGLTLR